MTARLQLTFVPGELVPAAGSFALWTLGDHGPGRDAGAAPDAGRQADAGPGLHADVERGPDPDPDPLVAEATALGLPAGEPMTLSTVSWDGGQLGRADVPARRIPMLATIRRLAAMPPGSDWPGWSRPSASLLAWSVAAKLALELVAAGRLVPILRPAADPAQALASWRVATADDPRLAQLAASLPHAAHALRRPSGSLWPADRLLAAFLDAVADACAREGRRPEIDPRRRGPRRRFGEMWAAALTGSEPTLTHLRAPVDELVADLDEWAAPLVGGDRHAAARLFLRLEPPQVGDDGSDALLDRLTAVDTRWRVHYGLQAVRDPASTATATRVWEAAGGVLELGSEHVEDPELVLVRGIATAARLFPPLDRSLSELHPTQLELTAGEVATLLTEGVDALTAGGIGVEVPPELAEAGDRRLRLRVRIGRTAAMPPRVDGADPLGLTSLTDLHYEVALGDDTLSAEEFAQIVALGQPLVRWRGAWVRVDPDEVERVRDLAGTQTALKLTEALAAALSGQVEVPDVGWVETVATGEVGALLERLRTADAPGDAIVVDLDGELRPYQRRGVAWLQRLTSLGMGAVLADEMGLGKTVEAIALLTSRSGDRPHLVVCPTSVVGNWVRELQRFAPRLEVLRHHGADRATNRRAFAPGTVVVTSYALLRRDLGMLGDVDWDVVVFDEAQQIKNPASKGARAARSLPARTRIAMTGTPIENRLSELWAIVDVTNPGLLGSQRAFNDRFAIPIERWRDAAAAERLRRLVAPFVLRRRKDDPEVALDLPPKQELTVICSLTREQASLYQAAVDHAFSGGGLGTSPFERRGRILALLTALKQICNHPRHYLRDGGRLRERSGKLTRATEILGEIVDAGDRALVFTQFREMGELLVEHLGDVLGLPEVPFLHGGVPLPRREAMVERFQEDDDAPPLLLVSLRAGGTGLNLTRASHVLHYDRWWNPAVEDQATDRAHRIGQTRAVTVHTLVAAGTIEERIADLLESKRSLADAIVGSGETWITELSDDELHELLALSTADLADDEPDDDAPGQPAGPAGGGSGRPTLVALPGGRA